MLHWFIEHNDWKTGVVLASLQNEWNAVDVQSIAASFQNRLKVWVQQPECTKWKWLMNRKLGIPKKNSGTQSQN